MKELGEFQKIISESRIPLDKEKDARLNVIRRSIMDSLLRHASKEDNEILPSIKKNRELFDRRNAIWFAPQVTEHNGPKDAARK